MKFGKAQSFVLVAIKFLAGKPVCAVSGLTPCSGHLNLCRQCLRCTAFHGSLSARDPLIYDAAPPQDHTKDLSTSLHLDWAWRRQIPNSPIKRDKWGMQGFSAHTILEGDANNDVKRREKERDHKALKLCKGWALFGQQSWQPAHMKLVSCSAFENCWKCCPWDPCTFCALGLFAYFLQVCALWIYLDRTRGFRQDDQLFFVLRCTWESLCPNGVFPIGL